MVRAWSFGFLEPAGTDTTCGRSIPPSTRPRSKVQENGKTYTITVELPGVEQRDVKVLVEDDVLNYLRREARRAHR